MRGSGAAVAVAQPVTGSATLGRITIMRGRALTPCTPAPVVVPVGVRLTRRVAAARSVMTPVFGDPAAIVPYARQMVRRVRAPPAARTSTMFAGRRRHEMTARASLPPVFRARIPM